MYQATALDPRDTGFQIGKVPAVTELNILKREDDEGIRHLSDGEVVGVFAEHC